MRVPESLDARKCTCTCARAYTHTYTHAQHYVDLAEARAEKAASVAAERAMAAAEKVWVGRCVCLRLGS